MRLAVFLVLLVGSALAVGVYSVGSGAGVAVAALRAVGTLIGLQFAYFAFLVMAGMLTAARKTRSEPEAEKA